MQSLGYRPNANARALVSKSSHTIGVLVNDVSAPFFGTMVKAIDTVACEQGKQLLSRRQQRAQRHRVVDQQPL